MRVQYRTKPKRQLLYVAAQHRILVFRESSIVSRLYDYYSTGRVSLK